MSVVFGLEQRSRPARTAHDTGWTIAAFERWTARICTRPGAALAGVVAGPTSFTADQDTAGVSS